MGSPQTAADDLQTPSVGHSAAVASLSAEKQVVSAIRPFAPLKVTGFMFCVCSP